MKKLVFIIIATFTAISLSACSEDNGLEGDGSTCIVREFSMRSSYGEGYTSTFDYDSHGRIIKIFTVNYNSKGENGHNEIAEIEYLDKEVIITSYDIKDPDKKDICTATLNDKGYAESVTFDSSMSYNDRSYNLSYDNSGYLIHASHNNNRNWEYVWFKGDLISYNQSDNGEFYQYNYEYTDFYAKQNINLSALIESSAYMYELYLIYLGLLGKGNTHLIKSSNSDYKYDTPNYFEYEFDSNNNPVKIISKSKSDGALGATYTIRYQ